MKHLLRNNSFKFIQIFICKYTPIQILDYIISCIYRALRIVFLNKIKNQFYSFFLLSEKSTHIPLLELSIILKFGIGEAIQGKPDAIASAMVKTGSPPSYLEVIMK